MAEDLISDSGPALRFVERIERREEHFILNGVPRMLTVTSNVLSAFYFSGIEGGRADIAICGVGHDPSVPHGFGNYRFRLNYPALLETPWGESVDLAGSTSRCLAFRPHFDPLDNALRIEPTPNSEDEDAFVVEVRLNLTAADGMSVRKGPFYLWADVMVHDWWSCGEEGMPGVRNGEEPALLGESCFAEYRELIRWALRRALSF